MQLAAAVLDNKPLAHTPDDAHEATKIATALRYLFRNGTPMYFDDDGLPIVEATKMNGQTRNGGFYIDAGACEHVINGKIKVEPGYIKHFTEDKVILNSGREREFDPVVFATGFSNIIDSIRATLSDRIADWCSPMATRQ
ncbi:hypothetical protein F4776DRAFT_662104 [Hypoxylon sp. NC0597]|nr:hypothetical protein F4776DRAFT_662104 [Hypoxylon sp. NC0597]